MIMYICRWILISKSCQYSARIVSSRNILVYQLGVGVAFPTETCYKGVYVFHAEYEKCF